MTSSRLDDDCYSLPQNSLRRMSGHQDETVDVRNLFRLRRHSSSPFHQKSVRLACHCLPPSLLRGAGKLAYLLRMMDIYIYIYDLLVVEFLI